MEILQIIGLWLSGQQKKKKEEDNYSQLVQHRLQNCQKLGWQASVKIYLLYSTPQILS
jgi:hypothetical protein